MRELPIQTILYRSREKLPLFLKSLQQVADWGGFDPKLYIAQHDGEDPAVYRELLERFFPGRYEFMQNENVGFGAGHNWLYSKFKEQYGDLFMLLNPDSLVFYDAFANLSKRMGQLKDWGQIEFTQFPHEHPKPYDPQTYETPFCSGASVIINRKAFDKVNGFDEAYFMYGEDVDLSWRIRYQGYKLYQLPMCKSGHYIGESSRDGTGESKFAIVHMQAAELYRIEKFGLADAHAVSWIRNESPYRVEAVELYNQMRGKLVRHPRARFMGNVSYKINRW